MLQSIRQHIQGWVAGVIIAVVALTFALWGIQNYLGGGDGKKKPVAHVGGEAITSGDFMRYYQQVVQAQPSYMNLIPADKQILKQQILAEMIEQKALLMALKQSGFSVSDAQIRSLIMKEPLFQQGGQFSLERFQQILSANGLSEEGYAERLKQQLVMAQLQDGLESSAFVTSRELESSYQLLNQKRDFGYFIVPAHRFLSEVKPTEQALKDYYHQHAVEWMQPERVSIAYLLLPSKKASELTEDKTSTFSDRLSDLTYTHPDSLAPAAKALGLTVQTTGLFSQEGGKGISAEKTVIKAAFSPEVLSGNNSAVIDLPDGQLMVLRVKQHVPQAIEPFVGAEQKVVERVKEHMAGERAAELAKLLQEALANGQQPLVLAKQHQLIWNRKSSVVHSDRAIPPAVLNQAFFTSFQAKKLADNIRTFPLGNGDFAVLQLQGFQLGKASPIADKERHALNDELQQFLGQLDYKLYVKHILDKAKVKIDQAQLDALS